MKLTYNVCTRTGNCEYLRNIFITYDQSNSLMSSKFNSFIHLKLCMSKGNQSLYLKLLEVENRLDQMLHHENSKPIQVQLLHKYNDIKDATQIVINHIANIEGTSISEIHNRLDLKD